MITGFNTDIKHGEKVFHVQTEDRGQANPVIESLVYVGGEILLSKKNPYPDLIKNNLIDEKAVRQVMDTQHRLIIEAIRRGRFDGAKPGDSSNLLEAVNQAFSAMSPAAAAATAAMLSGPQPEPPSAPTRRVTTLPIPQRPSAAPSSLPIASKSQPLPSPVAEPRTEKVSSSTPSGDGVIPFRSLDQVIIDYLAAEAAAERLEISFSRLGGDLVSGEVCSLVVKACTSLTGRPVAGAHITIRLVMSTAGPPHVLFRGTTGEDGLLRATVTLPDIGLANGAVIVAGSSPIGNHEAKQLVRKK